MKKVLILITISLSFLFLSAQLVRETISVENYLQIGVIEYNNNNFEKALDNFLLAENTGLINPDLYYNIGNAYFMLNNIPMAIVYYKRALLLNSSHSPARKNLDFVLTITRDSQAQQNENLLNNMIIKAFYYFSLNTLLFIILIIITLIIAIIHIQWRMVNSDRTILRFTNFILLFILLIFIGLAGTRYHLINVDEAVITNDTVYVYSGPSENFTRLFTIHEGTVCKIQREEAGWTQMTTMSGFSGWINSDTYLKIKK